MKLDKLKPWNWFNEEGAGGNTPGQPSKRGELLAPFQDEFERLFNEFANKRWWPSFAGGGDLEFLKPTLDISESDDGYSIDVEIPGVKKDDIKVEVHDGNLTIRGEKKQEEKEEKGDYHRVERRYGSFQRILNLPPDADSESVVAKIEDGVLKITMKKSETAAPPGRSVDIT